VEAYEMDEYKRGQLKAAFKEGREGGVFKDEEERRLESKKGAKEGERADLEWALKMMSKEKRDALKEEELLRAKMQQAYKVREGSNQCGTA
jgi:ATP-dependent RNA circularization protein (DNA/RNA ligase family)